MSDNSEVVATSYNAPQLRNIAADKVNLVESRVALPCVNLMNMLLLIMNIYTYLTILTLRL